MRIISYSVDGERDYGFMVSKTEFVPRSFIEDVIGLSIPSDVKMLLPDDDLKGLIEAAITGVNVERLSIYSIHLDPPISNPGKIICLGLNYIDLAEELGVEPPDGLPITIKPQTALTGPYDPIIKPRIVKQLDYEGELAVVVGKRCKDVGEEEALSYIFGYMVLNDISARDIQFRDGQWTRGKGFDSFAPIGPYLVSADEIGDPNNLKIVTRVNKEVRQKSSTSKMIHGVSSIISQLSMNMTLEPGDIIATGTPAGVGYAMKPEPRFLNVGDVIEVWIERIGVIRNEVIEEEPTVSQP